MVAPSRTCAAVAGRRDPGRRQEAHREAERERGAGALAAGQIKQPAAQHAGGRGPCRRSRSAPAPRRPAARCASRAPAGGDRHSPPRPGSPDGRAEHAPARPRRRDRSRRAADRGRWRWGPCSITASSAIARRPSATVVSTPCRSWSVIATISTSIPRPRPGRTPAQTVVVGQQLQPLEPAQPAQPERPRDPPRRRSPAPSAAVARRPPARGVAAPAACDHHSQLPMIRNGDQ